MSANRTSSSQEVHLKDRKHLENRLLQSKRMSSGTGVVPPRSDQWGYPLSPAQERLWFMDRMDPAGSVWNLESVFRIDGNLDVKALERSLDEILARHECLRSRIEELDGQLVQSLVPRAKYTLPFVDLGSGLAEGKSERLNQLIQRECTAPFKLQDGPLMRSLLIQVGGGEHVLIVVMHHIASDGWSKSILFRELSVLYNAFAAGEVPHLDPLPIQYADFAEWNRKRVESALKGQGADYWRRMLENAPAGVLPPTDYLEPSQRSSRGGKYTWSMDSQIIEALGQLAHREDATLFMVLLAAFNVFLLRYTSREQLLVGLPISIRSGPELERLIGCFVNLLLMKADLSGNPSFLNHLSQVRRDSLDAFKYSELPVDQLIRRFHPNQGGGGSRVLRTAFAVQNIPQVELELSGLKVSPFKVQRNSSQFDLCLFLGRNKNEWSGVFEFNSDLFKPETIHRMARHYTNLLRSIAARPDQPVGSLDLISPNEQEEIIQQGTGRGTMDNDGNVFERFEKQAREHPDSEAVVYGNRRVSYGELSRMSSQVGLRLMREGVEIGTKVAIVAERGVEMVAGMIGILKAGGAYIPVDLDYPQARINFLLEDSHAGVVLVQRGLEDRFRDRAVKVLLLDDIFEDEIQEKPGAGWAKVGSEDLAYVIYTSGSTGTPKGVCVPHRAIVGLVCEADYVDLGREDVLGQAANASFDAATFEIWGALLNGAKIVGVSKEVLLSPLNLWELLEMEGVTILFLTTALFNQLAEEKAEGFGVLKQLFFGGEKVDVEAVRKVLDKGGPERLVHVYGPTECTTFATWYEIVNLDPGAPTVPIGRPIRGARAYILDDNLKLVPRGGSGELFVGGEGLALCYHEREDLTRERFVEHPLGEGGRLYRTGDWCRHGEGGEIEFLQRRDRQVKLRGFRVELGEVENVVKSCLGVREVVVEVVEDVGPARLVGYLTGEQLNEETIRGYVKSVLPEYMIPSTWVNLEKLPFNAHGKLDRQALPKPTPQCQLPHLNSAVSLTQCECRIISLWKELLGRTEIGVDANFFDLGGHSLLLINLQSKIRKVMGVELPITALFEYSTVSSLANYIERGLTINGDTKNSPENRGARRRMALKNNAKLHGREPD